MRDLAFLLIFICSYTCSQETGKIVSVLDGDTVIVQLGDKSRKILRLAEVDCPEDGQPFGRNAKLFTSSQVYGKEVDFFETDVDRYGRSIAIIIYDNGKYLSEEIIKAGFGWWYYHYSRDSTLGELQKTAKYKKLGLWQDPKPVAPWEYRKKGTQHNTQ